MRVPQIMQADARQAMPGEKQFKSASQTSRLIGTAIGSGRELRAALARESGGIVVRRGQDRGKPIRHALGSDAVI